MGYQEVLIRSKKMTFAEISNVIQKGNNDAIDIANVVATINNDFSSNKMILFGEELEVDQLSFKAGEQFLVVCGERDAIKSVKNMFPFYKRNSIEIYPIERVVQSPENIGKDYKEIFTDSKLQSLSIAKKDSIVGKLSVYKGVVNSRDVQQEQRETRDTIHRDER